MKKYIIKLTRPITMPFWVQDLIVALPRIICGYLLTVEFGSPKFGLPWSDPDNGLKFFEVAFWFPQDVAAFGGIFTIAPALLAWLAGFAEAIGGIALILGFQTRIFSLLIVITMLVAVFVQHAGKDLWMQMPAMSFMWVAIFTMILGSGRFGLDFLLTKKNM